jgi:hypothetical protein
VWLCDGVAGDVCRFLYERAVRDVAPSRCAGALGRRAMWPRGRCRVPTGAAKRATTPSSDAPPTRRQLESTLAPRQPPAHRTPTPTHYSRSRCGTRSLHSRTTNPPHPAYIARLGCTRTRERGAGSSPFFTASLYWSAYYRGFQPAGSVVAQQVYCAQTVFTSCTFHHPHLPEAIGLSRSAF